MDCCCRGGVSSCICAVVAWVVVGIARKVGVGRIGYIYVSYSSLED